MNFENINLANEDDEDSEDKDEKEKNVGFLNQFLSRFKPRLEVLLQSSKPEKKEKESEDPTELPEVFRDNEEAETEDEKEKTLTSEEEALVLQSIADIHLNELDQEDEGTKVEEFLTELADSGDLDSSYRQVSIVSNNIKDKINNDDRPSPIEQARDLVKKASIVATELPDILQENTHYREEPIFETKNDHFFTSSQKSIIQPKNNQTNIEKHQTVSRRQTAFDILIDEITKIKHSELPNKKIQLERIYAPNTSMREEVSRTIMNLDRKVETTKEAIRLENSKPISQQISEKYSKTSVPENRHSIKLETTPKTNPESMKKPGFNLSDKEIIAISEKLKINDLSLKQIFQNREISFNGVKRVVLEYLTTGNFEKILKSELVLHQIDFEKDPKLRDIRGQTVSIDTYHSPKSVDELLQENGLTIDDEPIKSINNVNQTVKNPVSSNDNFTNQSQKINQLKPGMIDAVLVILILILLIILSYVLFFKI